MVGAAPTTAEGWMTMTLDRTSTARWEGDLEAGEGSFTVGDDVVTAPYTYASRFETGPGTNPEELLGAAHAACYAQFLAALLAGDDHEPRSIDAAATVSLDGDGPRITAVALDVTADVPGLDDDQLADYAAQAKDGCPVSKLFAGSAELTVEARLAG